MPKPRPSWSYRALAALSFICIAAWSFWIPIYVAFSRDYWATAWVLMAVPPQWMLTGCTAIGGAVGSILGKPLKGAVLGFVFGLVPAVTFAWLHWNAPNH
jgi:uncharacterized membrane protein